MSLLLSGSAIAGGEYIGKFQPHYWSDGFYILPVNVQATNKPACATRNALRLQESDQDSAVFKNKFSMILSAWLAGKTIHLKGTGQCSGEGDEIIFAIYL